MRSAYTPSEREILRTAYRDYSPRIDRRVAGKLIRGGYPVAVAVRVALTPAIEVVRASDSLIKLEP